MTEQEAKSIIGTINMLRTLALNIHGVIDVIDNKNVDTAILLVEKQMIPKQLDYHTCICGNEMKNGQKYCDECGQKFDNHLW